MGIETIRADQKGKEFLEFSKGPNTINKAANTNSKAKRGRRRRQKMTVPPMSPLQKLFETCKQVFAVTGPGLVPCPEDIERLRALLDDLELKDFGLGPDMPNFQTMVMQRAPAITYLHLHGCDKFSMGIFCLPPSGVIPLHNHPGMTVFSKLLFGSMHIKSYDWVVDVPHNGTPSENPSQRVRLAKVKVDSNFTAPNTSILYPTDGGNMHCFTALTACAVLDVLGPPYSEPDEPDGRHCAYYLDSPFANFSVDGVSVPEEGKEDYAWLQERDKPEDYSVFGALYRGPGALYSGAENVGI